MDREEENVGRFRRTSSRVEHPHAPHGVSDSASARLLDSSDNCAQETTLSVVSSALQLQLPGRSLHHRLIFL
ncbi:hypothetical protein BS78_05G006900 [Paspalum vaginatum]|nr:hypothetical protein BS78_05G006900 [Paspalum vaginatum]